MQADAHIPGRGMRERETERERDAASSAGGFHCATFSPNMSCQTHDLSTLIETAYVCLHVKEAPRASCKKEKSESER